MMMMMMMMIDNALGEALDLFSAIRKITTYGNVKSSL